MQPRIYTYKVTFEEIPHWYWGVHKEKKFGEEYFGSPTTHKWMWEFYTPRIQILEIFPFTEEGWKEANKVEDRIIRPDLNKSLCLNESCGPFSSTKVRADNGRKTCVKLHAKKDEHGRSLHAMNTLVRLHDEKDSNGKSKHAIKIGRAAAKIVNSQQWTDPAHPELGYQNSGNLVRMQKRRGYPHRKENRVRVE
jgi:hypothetical protein